LEERILILAPHGRDAEVIEQVLLREHMISAVCGSVGDLLAQLRRGAACALIVDEALETRAAAMLDRWLRTQPIWSDFPFVLLVSKGKSGALNPESRRIEMLGNVVLIERPVSGETLVSAARSALRARRRQYQARAMIAERAATNERLLRAARQKDDFLAMLAHELRNPLAPIRNAAESLKTFEANLPARVRWAGELIERQSRHLASLLEDLLDVSRITTGKITLKKTNVDFRAMLENALQAARPAFEGRQHQLDSNLPDSPVHVYGDPTRLAQVFGNLLDNAAKYTPEGGHIQVQASLDGGRVVATVKDDGIGISAADLPEIFELFAQSNRSLDRAQGGLGIGLSVVRSLIEMHGGTVKAHSDGIGCGSTIRVELPALPASLSGAAVTPMPMESSFRRPLRILVVDDNVDAADSLAMLLEMRGHHVRTAADGPRALEECRSHPAEVVLLDIGLPGMDGYEVARRLKGTPEMASAVLIAITGYGQAEDVARSMDAGFDHHLVKPVEPESLAALFESHTETSTDIERGA
jgi:signal transduction histidine kinase/ActR/RegA family two-component response regulator